MPAARGRQAIRVLSRGAAPFPSPFVACHQVCRGDEYAFGFDMWTVGVLAYEMLAGRSPFFDPTPGADNEQASEQGRPIIAPAP